MIEWDSLSSRWKQIQVVVTIKKTRNLFKPQSMFSFFSSELSGQRKTPSLPGGLLLWEKQHSAVPRVGAFSEFDPNCLVRSYFEQDGNDQC